MRGPHARLTAALVLLALAAPVSGCDATPESASPATPVCGLKIAVIGPLSGASADLGTNIRSGAALAVEQYNVRHPGCPVALQDFDSQSDPKQATALAQQIVADPAILGVVGPAFSGESAAALPLFDQGRVTIISPSATRTNLSQRGWSTFHRLLGNDAAQGPAAARYINTVLRASKAFVIDDTGAYGRGLADEVAETLSGKVVQRAAVPPRQVDFSSVVSQIRSAGADVVFYGGYYSSAGALLKAMRDAGLRATFVGGDGVKDPGFVRAAGVRAAEGAVITCACLPPERASRDFPVHYRAGFGKDAGTYSAEAYDAASIFLAGFEAGRTTRRDMEAFVDAYAHDGVTGRLQFTPQGELVDSAIVVWAYRVTDGAVVAAGEIPRT
ncbi:branched chain amino acid ABC transporter substrate-binding protein [Catellatospora methionotrophica]|uniref:Branched chain amino acid ABC transporter substrate-binding protein n=1 Tax=Catellatospora methionotrophica TaxID=121620 RepID=A0A8J3LMQ2_9ACTN|nr:branched-chain amino acid ABC transporter substrate-binding protein [Catellatospora methionotrophica]GIG17395.1 branched chain amino acid ABC transporter substrate-binding protein [Catellatospora methionotrophica]